MSTIEDLKKATLHEIYLLYTENQSKKNWIHSEPSWDCLSEEQQEWWSDFVSSIVRKSKQTLEKKTA